MSKTTSKPATRTRKRDLAVSEPTPKQKAEDMAAKVFEFNKEMNAAKSKHDKLRKELYSFMCEHGMKNFEALAGDIPIVAELVTPTGQAVDPIKLQKLVSMEQFLEMVSVSQKAVTDTVGGAVLNQVLVNTVGTENVKIAVKK